MPSRKELELDMFAMRPVPLRSSSPRSDHQKGIPAAGNFDDLELESDEDVLLDWQQYSHPRHICCGVDCSWLVERLPFNPFVPPEWWYSLTRQKRRLIASICIVSVVLLTFGVIIAIPTSIAESQDREREHALAPAPDLPKWPADGDSCKWADFYLPRGYFAPSAYDLHLNLTLQPPYIVKGHVRVYLDVYKPTTCVVLHATDMNITSAQATFNKQQQPGTVTLNMENQTATFAFKSALPKGHGFLDVAFAYILEDGLNGFYRSSYQDKGQTKLMAVTMFETFYARHAFPCFDEPEFKATFNVSLTVPPRLTVLGNMPLARKVVNPDGMVTWKMQQTPPMSSYLVAWAVGHLASQTGTCDTMNGREVDIGVWGTPPKAKQLKTAVDMACASVVAYEKLLNVPFPLPKLDLLGVPDFGAGAMENWGLIMYKERDLLVDPQAGSLITENYVAIVVAHEIAHHWFGDLVTCDNWTELWLNEGFASYFEFLGADAYKSNYSTLSRFYADDVSVALNADAQPSSHPLSVLTRLTRLSDADNYFDEIMYEKGGSVLRMLRAWMNRQNLVQFGAARILKAAEPLDTPVLTTTPFLNTPVLTAARFLNTPALTTTQTINAAEPARHGRLVLEGQWGNRKLAGAPTDEADGNGPVAAGLGDDAAGPVDAFMQGLHAYLEKFKYNTSGYADLWMAMGSETGLPVLDWMQSWTLRNGHPLLVVDFDIAAHTLTVRQQPFTFFGHKNDMACDDKKPLGSWWIPLSFKLQGSDNVIWTNFSSCSVTIPLADTFNVEEDYILINPGRYGFYRVNYSSEIWAKLIQAASDPSSVHVTDLAGLLDDSFRLAELGGLDITIFLELTKSLGARLQAPEWSSWHIAQNLFLKMSHLLAYTDTASNTDAASNAEDCYENMAKYIIHKLTEPMLNGYHPSPLPTPIGINFTVQANETVELRKMRQEVLKMAGQYGDRQYSMAAWSLLQHSEVSTKAVVHADVREIVYRLSVESDVPDAWAVVKSLYLQANDADEEYKLLKSLTAANSPGLIERSLQLALDSDGIKAADVGRFVQQLGAHSALSFNMTWEFLFQHFDRLVERSGDNAAYALGQSTMDLGSLFVGLQHWGHLEQFAAKWKDVLPPQFLNATRENIQQNAAWLRTHRQEACEWFAANV